MPDGLHQFQAGGDPPTKQVARKVCSKCGHEKDATDYTPRKDRPGKLYPSCKLCKGKSKARRYRERKEEDPVQQWSVLAVNWARHRARSSKIVVTINANDLFREVMATDMKCRYCGRPLDFKASLKARHRGPSVDRLDAAKGYTPDNITVSCYRCNQIKSDATPEELRRIADVVEALIRERTTPNLPSTTSSGSTCDQFDDR